MWLGDVGAADELGVCYDWQNKGMCARGERCPFAHCGCDTICVCTPEKNTYGQRPAKLNEGEQEDEGTLNEEGTGTVVAQAEAIIPGDVE